MDRKIIDYDIIANVGENLVGEIKAKLPEWQPYGPTVISESSNWAIQPMVRYEESSEIEALRVSLASLIGPAECHHSTLVAEHLNRQEPLSRLTERYGEALHRARVLLKQPEGQS